MDKGIRLQNNEKVVGELSAYQAELEMQNEELRSTQSQLQRSRDRLSAFFHLAPVGYVVLDQSSMIVDANQTIGEMLERSHQELLEKSFATFIDPADRNLFHAQFKAFFKNPKEKSIHLRLISGCWRPIHAVLRARILEMAHALVCALNVHPFITRIWTFTRKNNGSKDGKGDGNPMMPGQNITW